MMMMMTVVVLLLLQSVAWPAKRRISNFALDRLVSHYKKTPILQSPSSRPGRPCLLHLSLYSTSQPHLISSHPVSLLLSMHIQVQPPCCRHNHHHQRHWSDDRHRSQHNGCVAFDKRFSRRRINSRSSLVVALHTECDVIESTQYTDDRSLYFCFLSLL